MYRNLAKQGVPDLHNNELLRACKEDNDLLSEFLKKNKEFIFLILSQYKGNIELLKDRFNVSEEELLQHAYIGMITALREFDFDKGIKFSTYAFRPIIWEVNQLLYSDSKLVRLSRSAVDLIKQMEEIENSLGYFPSQQEMSGLLQVPLERIEEVLRFASDLKYFESSNDFDLINSSYSFEKDVINKVYVQSLMDKANLTAFEQKITELIMNGLNNSQIATTLGVYPMTISRALEKIKNKMVMTDKRNSKYDPEVKLIFEEMEETGTTLKIDEIKELLDVCGYDINKYSARILYYIRQRAIQLLEKTN
ncbi:sigma-70 family RNA polymerase sigma factor [Bacillus horti]|uniref:RNA polymerase sigma factor SigS n=1 Tax=Caldalkalibacillus horti TaxID=77523 RepID=A0ABT9VW00_9BACI|nr:RNA polymerase primary sigma factor/RNA polymerase sporulation-specific sigma factor [Bacillus horti]